jgi:hypothetical protein
MKKLLVILSLISIFLSVVTLFDCERGSFCCKGQHASSSQCSTCSPHAETFYNAHTFLKLPILSPTFLGNIFFGPINIESKNIIVGFDRPPAALS